MYIVYRILRCCLEATYYALYVHITVRSACLSVSITAGEVSEIAPCSQNLANRLFFVEPTNTTSCATIKGRAPAVVAFGNGAALQHFLHFVRGMERGSSAWKALAKGVCVYVYLHPLCETESKGGLRHNLFLVGIRFDFELTEPLSLDWR